MHQRRDEVARLILEGCSNKEIAAQLGMACRTVKAHCWRLFIQHNIPKGGIKRVQLAILLFNKMPHEENLESWVRLTPKELTVITLVAEGMTNKTVGKTLGTTEHVIKNYLRIVYDKIGLYNRVELALWYETHKDKLDSPTCKTVRNNARIIDHPDPFSMHIHTM